ncbi:MAG: ribokinase [Chloroflexi bacterium]|nr:ribokinase [Chloroflexota bacterium]OJV88207.1 MAG: ribokinase [Chloroflexi bacterium 54-19]
MSKIAVVGSLNMDMVVRASRYPGPGETVIGKDFNTIEGGKGANQAVAAARQGANVVMIGRVGDDDFGDNLLKSLRREHINTEFVRADAQVASGVAYIGVDDQGENRIIIIPGANGALSTADIDRAASVIASSDFLLLQLEIPMAVVTHAIFLAQRKGVKIILNAAPAQKIPGDLIQYLDYLVVNESEAALLTGLTPEDPARAALKLLELGAACVIVTLGERGALLAEKNDLTCVQGFKVKAVDTTAAGDSFVGALAFALGEGKPTKEAVSWANAAGAIATTNYGAQPSIPDYKLVASFVEKNDSGFSCSKPVD